MDKHLTLRRAEASDQDFLLALVESTREDLALLDHTVKAMLVRMQYDAQLSEYRRRFPGLEESIVLVGSASAGRLYVARSSEEIRIVDISLLPQFRGQGRLHVWQDNPAGALYRRLGFQPGEPDGMYLAMEWHPILLKE